MPDDVALEKVKTLEALGADVERVRPASIVDKKQVGLFATSQNGIDDELSLAVCSRCTVVACLENDPSLFCV
jgi:hypothetical protein